MKNFNLLITAWALTADSAANADHFETFKNQSKHPMPSETTNVTDSPLGPPING
ncbi:hypothetical protein [Mucilaginibacter sp. KACC 22063]|uniref:hypothetical protein n=1 Tax=Mucilaginibacter sp. KACC 22063 TaxID=3025666 RepID=UPI002366BE20|nr:hypothetical protein [Mucilaginibacter sp. KACC 22063]WDF55833.1 hypothetical protein PQ461_02000 [Mucilaginibacter sp. KACC 22063]